MPTLPCPTGWGYFLVFFILLMMSDVQLRALIASRRIQRRTAIETAHDVAACSTQVVIV